MSPGDCLAATFHSTPLRSFFHFLTIECFRFALVLTMLFLLVPGASCPAVVDLRELASRAKSKLPCLPDHYRPSQFTYLCMLGGAKLTDTANPKQIPGRCKLLRGECFNV